MGRGGRGSGGEAGAGTSALEDLERLYEVHYWPMVRLARLLLDHDEAEDVVQDVFLSVHRRGGMALRDPDAAEGYLRRAVVNVCRSSMRRRVAVRRRQRALEAEAWLARADAPSGESQVVGRGERDELLGLVAALPRRQRECVVLRYWAGLGDRGIAETLRISPGSVKQHLSRATATLRVRREHARPADPARPTGLERVGT
ncbi:RNA polymerase sigma factor [Aquipuribacter nitratireducens]|uniref:RNA polymerase sigma factor n=1 Tax=Aquipuribacter nitratireducens TaxID=650104 RepID=A0ABW0GJG0_9MICO